MFKILIATGIFPPISGGPATYSKIIAKEFSRLGHAVIVVTYSGSKNPKSQITDSKQILNFKSQIPKFHLVGVRRCKFKPLAYLKYFLKILKYGNAADIIYLQDPVSVGLPATLANLILRKRLVLKVVGDYAWEQASQFPTPKESLRDPTGHVFAPSRAVARRRAPSPKRLWRVGDNSQFSNKSQTQNHKLQTLDEFYPFRKERYPLKIKILKYIQTWVAKRADKILTPSQYLKNIVSEGWGVAPDKIEVVYNAVNCFANSSRIESRESVANRASGRDSNLIISVGRLVPWKGFQVLIEIVPELIAVYPKFRLEIVGDGPFRDNLQLIARSLQLEQYVKFLGRLSHQEVLNKLQSAGIFVLNSNYEGFSHQILEAMASGIPLAVSRAGGNSEVIRNRENGLLFDYDNKEQIKAAILKLWHDEILREKLVEQAKKDVAEFSVEKTATETLRVLSF